MCFRYLINSLSIGLLLLFFSSVSFGDDFNSQLSLGSSHTCFLKNNKVTCWGSDKAGQSTPPSLSNPKLIRAYGATSCALDDTGVVCWGSRAEEFNARNWGNPTQLEMSSAGECVINEEGVKCWAWEGNGPDGDNRISNLPKLINPTHVSVGLDRACALDDTGLVCWGDDPTNWNHPDFCVPQSKNRISLKVGSFFILILDELGLHWIGYMRDCEKDNERLERTAKKNKNPIQIDASTGFGCALTGSKVYCFELGRRNNRDLVDVLTPPKLINPVHVAVGSRHACAIDDTGVVCWGQPASLYDPASISRPISIGSLD